MRTPRESSPSTPGTERTYRSTVWTKVKQAFGQLCLREITPGAVSRAPTTIAKGSGSGAAKAARDCLFGMFILAIPDGAVMTIPVRDSRARLHCSARRRPALTGEQTGRLVELFHSNLRAAEMDPPDLVDSMLATGACIGEAPALRTGRAGGRPLLDLGAASGR